jgi:hypothetical protein
VTLSRLVGERVLWQDRVMPRAHHDLGGAPGAGPIDRTDHQLEDWEILADALNQALAARKIRKVDELRRTIEEIDASSYRKLSYYERWSVSAEKILIEKGLLTKQEIDDKLAEIEKRWGEP